MKPWKLAAAVWMACWLVIGSAHAEERFTPAKRHAHCRYESWNGHAGFTDHEVKLLISCAVDHYSVPGGAVRALYVANRESGYECRARNPFSTASGVLQITASTWNSWWSTLAPRLNPEWRLRKHVLGCRPNVMIGILAAHRWGWGPWGG